MADNLGPMAWLFLPENEQVQYLQKIATQKIHAARKYYLRCVLKLIDPKDFLHEVQFSAGIGPAHFLAETTRPLRPRLSAFSPLNSYVDI